LLPDSERLQAEKAGFKLSLDKAGFCGILNHKEIGYTTIDNFNRAKKGGRKAKAKGYQTMVIWT
jgi:hypothetical protein